MSDLCRRFAPHGVALVVSLCGAIVAWNVSDGAPLGIAIAELVLIPIIIPPLVTASRDARDAIGVAMSFVVGTLAVWILGMPRVIGWGAFAAALIVLLTLALAVAAMAWLLVRLRVNTAIAGAIVTILFLAWLSWPIWLSHQLGPIGQRALPILVGAHPIFAINGTSRAMGVWTQQPLMYRLTALGQDVAYTLPTEVWACAALHLTIAALCFSVSYRRRSLPAAQVPHDGPSGQ